MHPTVFIVHNGDAEYVRNCISSLNAFGARPILISDQSYSECLSLSSDIHLTDFKRFEAAYTHMSTNSEEFELFCFRRYFLIHHYAKTLNIPEFWHFDSDVLLLENLGSLHLNLIQKRCLAAVLELPQKFSSALSASAHTSFWTLEGLNQFLSFSKKQYQEDVSILKEKWAWHVTQGSAGGISDMALVYLWRQHSKNKVLNLSKMCEANNMLIDDNISGNTLNFSATKSDIFGRKKLKYVNQSLNTITPNGLMKIVTLHFQGDSKELMQAFKFSQNEIVFSPFKYNTQSIKIHFTRKKIKLIKLIQVLTKNV